MDQPEPPPRMSPPPPPPPPEKPRNPILRIVLIIVVVLIVVRVGASVFRSIRLPGNTVRQTTPAAPAPTPATTAVVRFDAASFAFAHPADWTLSTDWIGHDREWSVMLLHPDDGFVRVQAAPSGGTTPEALMQVSREQFAAAEFSFRGDADDGASYGDHEALGWSGTMHYRGVDGQIRMRYVPFYDGAWGVEIVEVWPDTASPALHRGRRMIESTLEIVPALEQPAVLERPRTHEAAGLTIRYPGNWTVAWDLTPPEDGSNRDTGGITIDSPQGAYVQILLYEPELTAAEEIEATVSDWASAGGEVRDRTPISTLGGVPGEGVSLSLVYVDSEETYRMRALVARLADGRMMELRTDVFEGDAGLVGPGIAYVLEESEFPLAGDAGP